MVRKMTKDCIKKIKQWLRHSWTIVVLIRQSADRLVLVLGRPEHSPDGRPGGELASGNECA